MEPSEHGVGFKIWGVDNIIYGPVELPELVRWVKDERVTAAIWVFSEKDDSWRKASNVPELRMFFPAAKSPGAASDVIVPMGAAVSDETAMFARKPGALRRIKVFADFSDEQLERFVRFMEVLRVEQFKEVVKQGQYGDAMYFVL